MRYAYIVVEGPHDVATIGKILELLGAKQVTKASQLRQYDEDDYWTYLSKPTFPHRGNLTLRMPVPSFYRLQDSLIAVHSADGEDAIVKTMSSTIGNLDDSGFRLYAVAMFCDADDQEARESFLRRKQEIQSLAEPADLISKFLKLESPGQVVEDSLRLGIYVFPDNQGTGTLETLLLECANQSYGDLFHSAQVYIDSVSNTYREKWKPTSQSKALIGCIANVLRPGTSNSVTIQKDEWFCDTTLSNQNVANLRNFLMQLLNL